MVNMQNSQAVTIWLLLVDIQGISELHLAAIKAYMKQVCWVIFLKTTFVCITRNNRVGYFINILQNFKRILFLIVYIKLIFSCNNIFMSLPDWFTLVCESGPRRRDGRLQVFQNDHNATNGNYHGHQQRDHDSVNWARSRVDPTPATSIPVKVRNFNWTAALPIREIYKHVSRIIFIN